MFNCITNCLSILSLYMCNISLFIICLVKCYFQVQCSWICECRVLYRDNNYLETICERQLLNVTWHLFDQSLEQVTVPWWVTWFVDISYFVDDELEVGHCQKEDFSCKLSRSSQVWHGMLCQLVMSCDTVQFHCCKSVLIITVVQL